MGRVYNALVRADRLKDADRRSGAPTDMATVLPFNSDSASIIALTPEQTVAHKINEVYAPSFEPPVRPVFEEPRTVANISELVIDPHVAALSGVDSSAAERYRALSARLLNLVNRRKLKTILITSAEAGEGKTTIATCLAWSLAKRPERRVALIDAGMTSGSAARYLGIEARSGWVDLRDGIRGLKEAMVRIDPNGLYVLTAHSEASFSSLDDVFVELTARFDIAVVDSPPILASPLTRRLATTLDGTVMVARACHTHRRNVIAARKLVPKDRRLGLVLNEVQ
jgi:Mrp family chromosome partitioning ATPase